MRGFYFMLLFTFLVLPTTEGQQDKFAKANNAYNSADNKQAISLYKEILSDGNESADLYLNLGNAYYKNGELGSAIVSYERGLKIDNTHTLLRQNLEYANKQIKTPITEIPDFFLSRYWRNVVISLGSTGWAVLQILLLTMIAFGVGIWLLSAQLRIKQLAFYSLILIIPILLLSILAGMQRYQSDRKSTHGIVVSDSSQLRTGASPQSELIIDISEGVKVELKDSIGEFYKVQLIDKEIGWISTKDIKAI